MPKNGFVLSLACLFSLLLPVGCTSSPDSYLFLASRPAIEVVDARVTEETEDGIRIEARLELLNPNRAELRLLHMRYDIDIEGWGRFSMTKTPPITLASDSEGRIILPAAFARPSDQVLEVGQPVRIRGVIQYEYDGDFRFLMTEAGVPLPTRSFSGQVDLNHPTVSRLDDPLSSAWADQRPRR
ncbi:MAG: hypothetical protein JJU36_15805 [Phycisphaeraceae bacterium]|nr:hypothetical protein [Phycisphaeraceae bacterium]